MRLPQNIYEIKRQARLNLAKHSRSWLYLGLVPTLVLILIIYLIFCLAVKITNQLPSGLDSQQLYRVVQQFVSASPQLLWYSIEAQLAYSLVAIGTQFAALNWTRGLNYKGGVSQSLQVFSGVYFFRVLFLWLICYGIFELGLQLLWIFGLYFSYGLRMVYFILKDLSQVQKLSWTQTLKTLWFSWQMMRGNKWRLFMLDLSFLGWDLLNGLTFGLTNLYVAPYKAASYAAFYQDILAVRMKAQF